jgi:hypothetical protein
MTDWRANLTKKDRAHLIKYVVPYEGLCQKTIVVEKLIQCLNRQHANNSRCWDCESIAQKLGIS